MRWDRVMATPAQEKDTENKEGKKREDFATNAVQT